MSPLRNLILILSLAGCNAADITAPAEGGSCDISAESIANTEVEAGVPNAYYYCGKTADPTDHVPALILYKNGKACSMVFNDDGSIQASGCNSTWTQTDCTTLEVQVTGTATLIKMSGIQVTASTIRGYYNVLTDGQSEIDDVDVTCTARPIAELDP